MNFILLYATKSGMISDPKPKFFIKKPSETALARSSYGKSAVPIFAAVLTVTVIFAAATGDDKTRRLCHIHPVDVNGGLVIDDLSASVADEIDVLVEIAFATVFPFVKLERLNDAVSYELVDRGVCGRKAQAFMLLSCLAVDEGRTGMNMPLLNQHIDYGQSLTCYAETFLLQPLNDRFFFHRPFSGIILNYFFDRATIICQVFL
jgi:hypothetical protein